MNIHLRASTNGPLRVDATAMFRALSDPTRLRILHLLREGPLCVGDVVTVLGIAQPTASRHLAYLRRAGLVEDERRGTWSFYALSGPSVPFHRKLLECVAAAEDVLSRMSRDDAALRSLRRKGGCCPGHERPEKSHRAAEGRNTP